LFLKASAAYQGARASMNGKNINPKKAIMGPKTSFTTSKQINKPQNAVTT
jgi:hypothetical protein